MRHRKSVLPAPRGAQIQSGVHTVLEFEVLTYICKLPLHVCTLLSEIHHESLATAQRERHSGEGRNGSNSQDDQTVPQSGYK